eukprot:2597835-Amphidinium_carterae.1
MYCAQDQVRIGVVVPMQSCLETFCSTCSTNFKEELSVWMWVSCGSRQRQGVCHGAPRRHSTRAGASGTKLNQTKRVVKANANACRAWLPVPGYII